MFEWGIISEFPGHIITNYSVQCFQGFGELSVSFQTIITEAAVSKIILK